MTSRFLVLPVCLLLAFAGAAQARPTNDLQLVIRQQHQIAEAFDRGETEGLSDGQVVKIRKAQNRVFVITHGKDNIDQINRSNQVELANLLDSIKVLMGDNRTAREEQQVCKNERILGSNIMQIRCGTHEEMDFRREMARNGLEKMRVCGGPGCVH